MALSFTNLLRNFRSTVAAGRLVRNHRRSRTCGAVARFRPRFEALEARAMLSGTGWLLTSAVTGSDPVRDLAQDSAGNTYVTGDFSGTMTIGSTILTSNGAKQDLFVAKLDPSGNLLWAQNFGGTGTEYGNGIDVGSDDSVYVTGIFEGAMTFPTASGPITLTSAGGEDFVVFKLDAGGNAVWARRAGAASNDTGRAVAVAGDGSVYVVGQFDGTVAFGAHTLSSAGGAQIQFLTKMSDTGEFLWARQLDRGGMENVLLGRAGGVFVVGDNVARFDAAGTRIWYVAGQGGKVGAIYEDPLTWKADLYISDIYANNGGPHITEGVVRKLNGDTGAADWEKTVFAPESGALTLGAAADAAGNLYLTGGWGFSSSATDFDPGPGTYYLTSNIAYDIFLLKLNSAGDFVSARRMGAADSGYDFSHDVEVDSAGNVFLSGQWSGTSDFDLGDSTVVRTSPNGGSQGFVLKMTQGLGAISGRIFADADGNGTQGTDEPPVEGATVYLDQNGNSSPDLGEPSVTSGVYGVYNFKHLPAGTYTVRQVVRAGWTGSTPAGGTHIVTLAADQFVGDRDFGAHSPPTTSTYTKNTSLSIQDLKTVTSTIVVSGGTSFIYDVDVRVNITHANDADLDVFLIAPDGTRIELTTDNGGTGDHYTNTIFDDEAALSITAGAAPFSGRYRPEAIIGNDYGKIGLSVLDGKNASGTWTLQVYDDTRRNTGTLLNWSLTVKGASTGSGLQAAQVADEPESAGDVVATLTTEQLQPILAEAVARWSAAGVDTSNLSNVAAQIVDLADGYLGMADGNTIYLDDNAAGWGWFVDATPQNDFEYLRLGNQGEQNRMDLLTVVMHELGHFLDYDHDQEGVMTKALAAGVRQTGTQHDHMALVDQVFDQPVDHHVATLFGALLDKQLDSRRLWFRRRR